MPRLYVAIVILVILGSLYASEVSVHETTQTTTGGGISSTATTSTTTGGGGSSTVTTSTTASSSSSYTNQQCTSCLSAPQTNLNAAVNYFVSKFNPQVDMIAVGTQTSCAGSNSSCSGVQFYYMDSPSDACPILAPYYRILPNENWMDAGAFVGMGVQTSLATTIFNSLDALKTTVGWVPADNRESMLGYPISYSKSNVNICFTASRGPPLYSIGGQPYQIAQAARWDYSTQSYVPWDNNVTHALSTNNPFNEEGFQVLNLYIRHDLRDAQTLLQNMANQCQVDPDGSVGFTSFHRGMYLGVFLEAVEVVGTPTLESGCSLSAIESTIWGLQQSDGGIARNYTDLTHTKGSDDETTNAALIAFSPGIILHLQYLYSANVYNLSTPPNTNPALNPLQ